MAQIRFDKVSKTFNKTPVIGELDLTVCDGSFTVLVGPSGCGKTTLLRMLAGVGPATSGKIWMDGKDITDVPPGKRDVAMVFQNYAIYPTMSVKGNIEFGLKNKRVPKAERERLISEVTQSVGLYEYLDRKPSTLSGGQRQRVALARAMVKKPRVFLMDEPLSNLDAKLRVAMRSELIEIHRRLRTTFVYVTHDQVEAMSMADQIVLMDKGRIQQEASPDVLYRDPDNVFTAQFIGTPPMNLLHEFGDYQIGFRPEKARLSADPLDTLFAEHGEIITREMLGSETLYKVRLDEQYVMVKSADDRFRVGALLHVCIPEEDLYLFGPDERRVRKESAAKLRELLGARRYAYA